MSESKEPFVDFVLMSLRKDELELISHLIYNYEQNFHDRRAENHALDLKVKGFLEDLDMSEYLESLPVDEEGELIDNK